MDIRDGSGAVSITFRCDLCEDQAPTFAGYQAHALSYHGVTVPGFGWGSGILSDAT